MEISNLSGAELKTLVIRMLKELIGSWNSIKKTQAEMKVTLIGSVKLIFTGGHISLAVAFKELNVILGL